MGICHGQASAIQLLSCCGGGKHWANRWQRLPPRGKSSTDHAAAEGAGEQLARYARQQPQHRLDDSDAVMGSRRILLLRAGLRGVRGRGRGGVQMLPGRAWPRTAWRPLASSSRAWKDARLSAMAGMLLQAASRAAPTVPL